MTVDSHQDCGPLRSLAPEDLVFVSRRVYRGRPVVRVHLDGDGDWQVFSGVEPRWMNWPRLIHAAHLFDLDPSLASLPALPPNHVATREDAAGTTWRVFRD